MPGLAVGLAVGQYAPLARFTRYMHHFLPVWCLSVFLDCTEVEITHLLLHVLRTSAEKNYLSEELSTFPFGKGLQES